MPMLRRVFRQGDSRAVTLPKGWLDYTEQKAGKRITRVAVSEDGDGGLRLKPIFEK